MSHAIPHTTNAKTQLKLLLTLIIGILIGFSLSELLKNSNCEVSVTSRYLATDAVFSSQQQQTRDAENTIKNEYEVSQFQAKNEATVYNDYEDATIANKLFNKTRVLCWVLTSPANHERKAQHLKKTWGARCNKLLFMSSAEDKELGAVNLNVSEGRGNLWQKTREAVRYIYEHHFNDADWFFKADDDTYVVMENLRAFLHQFSAELPVYFGCKFKPMVRQGYMSGGAGYALSKEALRRFMEQAYPNKRLCRQRMGGAEDKEMGLCLQNVGVVAGDSRDIHKRGRFFPSGPQGHLIRKDKSHWYWNYIYYNTTDGLDCCSNYAISFHYIQPSYFYVLDYLIYRLRPFGINYQAFDLPATLNATGLLEKWRNEVSDNPDNST